MQKPKPKPPPPRFVTHGVPLATWRASIAILVLSSLAAVAALIWR